MIHNTWIRWVIRHVITLGPVGYLPAPGTCGTVAAIPILVVMRMATSYPLVAIILLWAVAAWCIDQVINDFYDEDPSEVVIDEVIGFAVTMYGFPLDWKIMLLAFVMFRIFDIAKPFNIDQAEVIPGAWGIILDDVVAGAFANIVCVFVIPLL